MTIKPVIKVSRSLSGLGNLSENSAGRGQILTILKVNSCSIGQESGEIWIVQTDLQQIYSKADRLLNGYDNDFEHVAGSLEVKTVNCRVERVQIYAVKQRL